MSFGVTTKEDPHPQRSWRDTLIHGRSEKNSQNKSPPTIAFSVDSKTSTSMSSAKVGFSLIPEDVLILLAKRLPRLSDIVRFGAVCREWRTVAVALQQDLRPFTFPSLILADYFSDPPAYRLHCPCIPVLQELHMQPPRKNLWGRMIGGSSDGWIVETYCASIGGSKNIDLVNLLLETRIQVPSSNLGMVKAAVSCGRQGGKDPVVMAVTWEGNVLSARPGDTRWCEASCPDSRCITDVMYRKDRFYAVAENGRLVVWKEIKDESGWKFSFIVKQPLLSDREIVIRNSNPYIRCRRILVDSAKGELLLIVEHIAQFFLEVREDETYWFDVFKLEDRKGSCRSWLKLKSLGEDALFLANGVSFAVSAATFPICEQNCIYFLRDHLEGRMYVYSMGKRRIVERRILPKLPGQNYSFVNLNDCHWLLDRTSSG